MSYKEIDCTEIVPPNKDQLTLFDIDPDWKKEWHGMPEYINGDKTPYRTLPLHFKSREDVIKFSELIGQRITEDTRYVWYPKPELSRTDRVYIDEP